VDGLVACQAPARQQARPAALVSIIAYGDMGLAPLAPGSESTTDRIIARVTSTNVTCLLHLGDISYAMGVAVQWDGFMNQIQPIAAHISYMVAIGNHEYDYVLGGDKDPSGAPGPFRPAWWVSILIES